MTARLRVAKQDPQKQCAARGCGAMHLNRSEGRAVLLRAACRENKTIRDDRDLRLKTDPD